MATLRPQVINLNASNHGHDVYHGHRHEGAVGQEFDAMCTERFLECSRSVDFTERVLAEQIANAETASTGLFVSAYDKRHQRLGQLTTATQNDVPARAEIITLPARYEALPSEQEQRYAA